MTRQGLELILPNHLHRWLGEKRYSNRRRRRLVHCWPTSNHTNHHSNSIPTGTWCSSIQAELKAIENSLQIIQAEESRQKFGIVSDSQLDLHRIANLQPAIPLNSADESDILGLPATLYEEGHQITFTCCQSHCGVMGN